MTCQLKKPLSYQEQIENLKTRHGLVIENEDEAKQILATVNYYRLSAYGIGLKDARDPEKYVEGITLGHIYRLYCFDAQIRTLLIPMIEQLEIKLRTQIAYHLAMTYGAESFRDARYFCNIRTRSGETVHERPLRSLTGKLQNKEICPVCFTIKQNTAGISPFGLRWSCLPLVCFRPFIPLCSARTKMPLRQLFKRILVI